MSSKVRRTTPWWFSSDHTRFFEAEIMGSK
jgi:hypothetical protein